MFYTNNRFSNMAEMTVEPNMAYAHENGALAALIDGYENERSLFEAAIYTDVQENTLMTEGASEEKIQALQENAITSFFVKIKELFKKLWEKIKAVFHAFIAKFDSWFKSGDKLVKKYRAELMQKNLKGVEIKFSVPKNWADPVGTPNSDIRVSTTVGQTDTKDFDSDKEECLYLEKLSKVQCSDPGEFDEAFHDAHFNDKDDVDAESIKNDVLSFLEKKDAIKNVENLNKGLDKAIQNVIKAIDAEAKEFNSKVGTGAATVSGEVSSQAGSKSAGDAEKGAGETYHMDNKADKNASNNASAGAHKIELMRKKAGCCQAAINKYTNVSLKEIKGLTSSCKAALARMVAAKEESTLLDYIEDAVMYENEIAFRDAKVVVDPE